MTMQSRWPGLGSWVTVLALGLHLVAGLGPAEALDGAPQLLIGGTSANAGGTRFTAPGLANVYGPDFPTTGLGEQAAQIRMPAGTLKKLKFSVVTDGTQTSGTVTVMVRINGADTALTCSLSFVGGDCKEPTPVVLVVEDRLAIQVVSTLDTGLWAFSYVLKLE